MALVAILAVLVMFGLFAALSSLSDASIRVKRDQITRDALIRAKEALIAYAVSDTQRPGELPCPDIDDDGRSLPGIEYVGTICASYTGRVPWATLGLPDLRDDAGERIWYTISTDFRSGWGPLTPTPLNSDTAYRPGNTSLNIAGTQPAGNLVAIVFAPGTAVTRSDGWAQTRACTGGTCDATGKCITAPPTAAARCDPRNYLDRSGTLDNADLDVNFVSAADSSSFNDRLLPIYSDDIMSIVQRRAGRELAQKLREHFTTWQNAAKVSAGSRRGFYPYAAALGPMVDPSVLQPGSNGTMDGLLPLGAPAVVWDSASISGGACAGVGTTQITCTALVLLGIGGNVSARVRNVATGFIQPPDGTEMTTGGLVLLGAPAASPWTLDAATRTLDFSSGISFVGTGIVTVTVRAPNVITPWVYDATWWVNANNWYQDTYYVVSPGYSFEGNATCAANCVTVGNTAAPNDDKRAVLVMTGRALQGQRARPPLNSSGFTTSDYLEGANQTPADFILARDLRTPTFNDEPIVVLP